jgi:hypothetical protein
MFEEANHEVHAIQELVLVPTPHNFQSANNKLEWLAAFLSRLSASPDGVPPAATRDFLLRIRAEMARLHTLMSQPVMFYQSLETLRAVHFGSYERSGNMRSLEPTTHVRTIVHL